MKSQSVKIMSVIIFAIFTIAFGCAFEKKIADDKTTLNKGYKGTIYSFKMGAGATPSMVLARISNHVPKTVLAARGWDNGLWWIYEKPNGSFRKWKRLGSNIKRDPIITLNEDERLEVFATGQDDFVYHTYQQSINGSWSSLIKLGNFRTNRPIQVVSNEDRRLEVFAVHPKTHKLWHTWQLVPNGPWSEWHQLGASPSLHNFVLTKNRDQRLEVFAIKKYSYELWHVWQVVVNGNWSHWFSFNGLKLSGDIKPVISKQSNGRLIIFVRGDNYLPYSIQQQIANGPWEGWKELPGCSSIRQMHVYYNDYWNPLKRKLALFNIDFSNNLCVSHQLNPDGNNWSSWHVFSGTLASEPVIGHFYPRNESFRRMMVFAIFLDGSIRYKWQNPSDSTNWSQWENLSPDMNTKFVSIKLIEGYYGCINLFAVDEEGIIKHIKQEVNDYTFCNDPDHWGKWQYLWNR